MNQKYSPARRRFLGISAAFLGSVALGCASTNAQNARPAAPANAGENKRTPMNIVFINADDMGIEMGAYGDTQARTPHLDAFAAQSAQFINGYVTQASCSPSRSSFLTGLYPHQNGMLGLAHLGYRVHDDVVTLPQMMKEAGYYNAIIGKLHLEPDNKFPFDYSQTDARKTWDVADVAKTVGEQIAVATEQNKPFFVYLNYFDPHTPFHDSFDGIPADPMKPAQVEPLRFHPVSGEQLTPDVREQMAGYYNGIARVDAGVSMVLELLKKTGHADDTLVIFVGDHGAPFPRAKNSTYESGLKVPFLVRWPDQTVAHKDERLVSTIDLMPTILDAAGIEVPAGLPGASLRPLMKGGEARWRTTLGAENNAHGAESWFPQRTIRDARYKLIYTVNPGKNPKPVGDGGTPWRDFVRGAMKDKDSLAARVFATQLDVPAWQLYDLQKDPHEFDNLAGRAELVAVEQKLRAQLFEWRVQTRDPLLDPNYLAALNAAHARAEGARFDGKAWYGAEPKAVIPKRHSLP